MIKLLQFPAFWGLPNPSPFCLKLETYLRMVKLPYEIVTVANPRKEPKGKLPCIIDEGKKIPDSGFIITYLKDKYGDPLDAHLSPSDKASGLALQRLMEEHLYWAMVYSRWIANWKTIKHTFFRKLPFFLRIILPNMIYKNIISTLYAQGMGRHTPEEIYQLGLDDLRALSALLKEKSFLLGENPTSIDACGYAFLAEILYPPLPSPLQDYVQSDQILVNYCSRMKALYF